MDVFTVSKGLLPWSTNLPRELKALSWQTGIAFSVCGEKKTRPCVRRTDENTPQRFYLMFFSASREDFLPLGVALVNEQGQLQAGLDLTTNAPIPSDQVRAAVTSSVPSWQQQMHRSAAEEALQQAGTFCFLQPGKSLSAFMVSDSVGYTGLFFAPAGSLLGQADLALAWQAARVFMETEAYTILGLPKPLKGAFKQFDLGPITAALSGSKFTTVSALPPLFGGQPVPLPGNLRPLDLSFWDGLTPTQAADKAIDVRMEAIQRFLNAPTFQLEEAEKFRARAFVVPPDASAGKRESLARLEATFERRIGEERDLRTTPAYRKSQVLPVFRREVLKPAPRSYPRVLDHHLLMLYLATRSHHWHCPTPPVVFFNFPERKAPDGQKEMPAVFPVDLRIPFSRVLLDSSLWEESIDWVRVLKEVSSRLDKFDFINTSSTPESRLADILGLFPALQIELSVYTAEVGKEETGKEHVLVLEVALPEQQRNLLVYRGSVSRSEVQSHPNLLPFFTAYTGPVGKASCLQPVVDLSVRMATTKLSAADAAALDHLLKRPSISRHFKVVTVPAQQFFFRYRGEIPGLETEVTEAALTGLKHWPTL